MVVWGPSGGIRGPWSQLPWYSGDFNALYQQLDGQIADSLYTLFISWAPTLHTVLMAHLQSLPLQWWCEAHQEVPVVLEVSYHGTWETLTPETKNMMADLQTLLYFWNNLVSWRDLRSTKCLITVIRRHQWLLTTPTIITNQMASFCRHCLAHEEFSFLT